MTPERLQEIRKRAMNGDYFFGQIEMLELLDHIDAQGKAVDLLSKQCLEQIEIQQKKSAALKAMLKFTQWSDAYPDRYCPHCRNHKHQGHKPNCELAKLLEEGT